MSSVEMRMAWYTESTFNALRALPEAKIDIDYLTFIDRYNRMVIKLDREGVRAVQMQIDDIDQMVQWCHKHGYQIDNLGRARFGAMLAIARDQGKDIMTMPFEDRSGVLQ